jgi:single-stranded-DNA-specific exonuclease
MGADRPGEGQVLAGEQWYLRRKPIEGSDGGSIGEGLDPVLTKVLYARHIDTSERIEAFLGDKGTLGDPFQMAGMSQAIGRIRQALERGEQIVVYGDFDADGVSATALLVSALTLLGGRVQAYIPDRFSEGYGINAESLCMLRRGGARLVVSADCGVRSASEVAQAQADGLDVIITDHHAPLGELPPAVAVVDPKREDCGYPFKELAGVGVAHRLAEGLFRVGARMGQGAQPALDADQYLDLVALGTVSDIVPLVGENRLLVRRGLAHLNATMRVGLRALMDSCSTRPGAMDSQSIAFRLGPRLNAAGRLRTAQLAYDLLTTTSEEEARQRAQELSLLNQQRQQMLENQLQKARELLKDPEQRRLLIVRGPMFHEGIVGLVASRLSEEFHRPAIVMREGEETTRGSARSIEGFHITQALDACADLLLRHGGHARAAGFTVANENLSAFCERLERYGAEHMDAEILHRKRRVDARVALDEITVDTPRALAALEPFGEGNPEPALATTGLRLLEVRAVGAEAKHLRLRVSDGVRSLTAIAFRQGQASAALKAGDTVDLIHRPTLNDWQGQVSLELVVQAIRVSQ